MISCEVSTEKFDLFNQINLFGLEVVALEDGDDYGKLFAFILYSRYLLKFMTQNYT